MSSEKSNKRRIYVVDKKFQYRLIATFLFSILGALVIFSVASVAYFWVSSSVGDNMFKEYITIDKQIYETRTIEEDGQKKTIKFPTTKTIHGVRRWEIVLPPLLLNNLMVMVVLAVIGVVTSHKIAGPMYRMRRTISSVLAGERGVRISLRKHDKLNELADDVNALIELLEVAEDEGNKTETDL